MGIHRGCAALVLASVVGYAPPAEAQLTEPDGTQVPMPPDNDVGSGTWGTTVQNVGLPGLFASRGEDIDWQADATTSPGVFSPRCTVGGALVLRGGGCAVDFGWYNVDPDRDEPPSDAEIYPLIAKELIPESTAFFPIVGDPPIVGTELCNIGDDPRYSGGLVGFAIVGNPASMCTQTKYTEHRLNTVCTACTPMEPWITTIMWRSTVTPNSFYIGFEDLPMSPEDFRGYPGQSYPNDGDFNDFVYFIEGIACEDSGQPCLTNAQGACALGLTQCRPNGSLVCVQNVPLSDEICDGVDNDCNGRMDDGDLCATGEVCEHGVCAPTCVGAEARCSAPLVCDADTGQCAEPACAGVVCDEPGEICVAGACAKPALTGEPCADGLPCPTGFVCQAGKCFDTCTEALPGEDNPCADGKVCDNGLCVEPCHCQPCPSGMLCDDATSLCVDNPCHEVDCLADEVCRNGVCDDPCANVVCPEGGECIAGACPAPLFGPGPVLTPVPPSTGGTGATAIDDPGNTVCTPGYTTHCVGPDGCDGTRICSFSGPGYGDCECASDGGNASGCACREATSKQAGHSSFLGLALTIVLVQWRRRRRAALDDVAAAPTL